MLLSPRKVLVLEDQFASPCPCPQITSPCSQALTLCPCPLYLFYLQLCVDNFSKSERGWCVCSVHYVRSVCRLWRSWRRPLQSWVAPFRNCRTESHVMMSPVTWWVTLISAVLTVILGLSCCSLRTAMCIGGDLGGHAPSPNIYVVAP